jgi:hypothetical protein
MASRLPEYRLGRIVAAQLLGRNGRREEHPAVIISPDDEITQPEDFDPRGTGGQVRDNEIAVLGISTKYRNFSDPYVVLPVGKQTQLTRDSAVILNWYAALVIPDDLELLLGDVPSTLMLQINDAYRKDLSARLGGMMGTVVQILSRLQPRS